MPREHVVDDIDLFTWVDNKVINAGAYWSSGRAPQFEFYLRTVGEKERVAVVLDRNDATFHSDGSRLKIDFEVVQSGIGWGYEKYSFHTARRRVSACSATTSIPVTNPNVISTAGLILGHLVRPRPRSS